MEAQEQGVAAIGVESHPFVARVARVKIDASLQAQRFKDYSARILKEAEKIKPDLNGYPPLICKMPSRTKPWSDSTSFASPGKSLRMTTEVCPIWPGLPWRRSFAPARQSVPPTGSTCCRRRRRRTRRTPALHSRQKPIRCSWTCPPARPARSPKGSYWSKAMREK